MTRPFLLLLLYLLYSYPMALQAWDSFTPISISIRGVPHEKIENILLDLGLKPYELIDEKRSAAIINQLYATSLYESIELRRKEDQLKIYLTMKPQIFSLSFTGIQLFDLNDIQEKFQALGIEERQILDTYLLRKAIVSLKEDYLKRGYRHTVITPNIFPLKRGRVDLEISVEENSPSQIKSFIFYGNHAFSDRVLKKHFFLSPTSWTSWLTQNNLYSSELLKEDLERLSHFYKNQGYLDFEVSNWKIEEYEHNSKQLIVHVTLDEGNAYHIQTVSWNGENALDIPLSEIRPCLKSIRSGDLYQYSQIIETVQCLKTAFENNGYSFARINPVLDVHPENNTVDVIFTGQQNQRFYVRQIHIAGNTFTRDSVIRRELRQLEGTVLEPKKVQRSQERLERLGFFSNISIQPSLVPERESQLDFHIRVAEQATGSVQMGAGYSSSEAFLMSGSISYANLLGAGYVGSLQLNTGQNNRNMSLSLYDPYWSSYGMGAGMQVYWKNSRPSEWITGEYRLNRIGTNSQLVWSWNEYISSQLSLGVDRYILDSSSDSPEYVNSYINRYGRYTDIAQQEFSILYDTRDNLILPTKGWYIKFTQENSFPYYLPMMTKLSTLVQYYLPLPKKWVLFSEFQWKKGLGFDWDYQSLPFFRAFYAGGIGSIRGFYANSLGPQDALGGVLGGSEALLSSLQLFFPPLTEPQQATRLSLFLDFGELIGSGDYLGRFKKFSWNNLYASVGLGFTWLSPVGPIQFSYAFPFRTTDSPDRVERFQFSLGSSF